MIKFKNITNLKDFKQGVKENKFLIEKISPCKWVITDCRLNPKKWELFFSGRVDEWALCFSGKWEKSFSVKFLSYGDNVEIYSAIWDGRNEKSDNRLKKYKDVCTMANCFINSGFCKA